MDIGADIEGMDIEILDVGMDIEVLEICIVLELALLQVPNIGSQLPGAQ
jgi:hypothetical protein